MIDYKTGKKLEELEKVIFQAVEHAKEMHKYQNCKEAEEELEEWLSKSRKIITSILHEL